MVKCDRKLYTSRGFFHIVVRVEAAHDVLVTPQSTSTYEVSMEVRMVVTHNLQTLIKFVWKLGW